MVTTRRASSTRSSSGWRSLQPLLKHPRNPDKMVRLQSTYEQFPLSSLIHAFVARLSIACYLCRMSNRMSTTLLSVDWRCSSRKESASIFWKDYNIILVRPSAYSPPKSLKNIMLSPKHDGRPMRSQHL